MRSSGCERSEHTTARRAGRGGPGGGSSLPPWRAGQATTEYLLLLSFLVVGLLVAAYAFLPGFEEGIDGLNSDTRSLISAGTQDGHGDKR